MNTQPIGRSSWYPQQPARELEPRVDALVRDRGPVWGQSIAERLVELLHLQTGWDGYRAQVLDRYRVGQAFELLYQVVDDRTPKPQVVPTLTRGVQFEWHTPRLDVELELSPTFRCNASFEDAATGEEASLEEAVDLTQVQIWLRRLSA